MVVHDTMFLPSGESAHVDASPVPADEQLRYWESTARRRDPARSTRRCRAADVTPDVTAAHVFDLPPGVAARLADLADRLGVSLLDVSVATLQIVLARYSGSEDVCVATTVDRRDRPADVVVLRSRVTAAMSFEDFLRGVRATVAAAFAHSEVAFDRVAGSWRPGRELAGALAWCARVRPAPFPVDLTVRLSGSVAGLSGIVEYRAALFAPATIERLAGQLTRVLDTAAADPTIRLGRIDVLTEPERARLLVEWNDTDRDVTPATFPELFEAQVRADSGRGRRCCSTGAR